MLSQKHPEPACCQKGTLCSEVNSTSLRGPAALPQQKPAGLWHQGENAKNPRLCTSRVAHFLQWAPHYPGPVCGFSVSGLGRFRPGAWLGSSPPRGTETRQRRRAGGAGEVQSLSRGIAARARLSALAAGACCPLCQPCARSSPPWQPALRVFEVMAPAVEPGLFSLSLSFLSKGFIKILGRQRQRHHLESLGEFCHRAETHQQCLGAACCGALASLW